MLKKFVCLLFYVLFENNLLILPLNRRAVEFRPTLRTYMIRGQEGYLLCNTHCDIGLCILWSWASGGIPGTAKRGSCPGAVELLGLGIVCFPFTYYIPYNLLVVRVEKNINISNIASMMQSKISKDKSPFFFKQGGKCLELQSWICLWSHLVDWLYIFFVTIAGKGLQNSGLVLTALSMQGWIFHTQYMLWHGTSVYVVTSKGLLQFSRILLQAKDTEDLF